MKVMKYIFGGLLMLTSIVGVSCSNDDASLGTSGQLVRFSLRTTTRTVYGDGTNVWNISWVENDQILIHSEQCPEPVGHEAQYRVTGGSNQGDISPVDEANQLLWNSDADTEHTFAAAYPASKATYVSSDKFKFPVPLMQSNATDFMDNAYMVARSTGIKKDQTPGNVVLLNFTPIMTTFEVTVQGATGNAALSRTITSLEFKTNMPWSEGDFFTYNTATNVAEDALIEKTITWTPASNTTIPGSATSTPNTISFNVFIPFVAISSTNPLVIAVNFKDEADADHRYTATLSRDVEAGAKKRLKLPALMPNEYPEGISGEHEGFAEVVNLEF